MRLNDFNYDLPENLIAQYPLAERSASRLLVLNRKTQTIQHQNFTNIEELLQPGDLLVFNNTQVIPARLYARKASGGKAEILIERILDSQQALAHVRASKTPKVGSCLFLENGNCVQVIERREDLYVLHFTSELSVFDILKTIGRIPLPPYMRRDDEQLDRERYQTIYAANAGAVAAPTAGLHFTTEILEKLHKKGVEFTFITLHVGSGTFLPVRVDDVTKHQMHAEYIDISAEAAAAINIAKAVGKRIIAVGTTVVRCLESAAKTGVLQAYQGETAIFIYPGYQFQCIDGLITNFHAPCSTLMMLVSALAGYHLIMDAYAAAIAQQYRFLSYGDAMFILPD